MKKMIFYEPAMCCSTGVCGPKVDKELLRISTTLERLKKNGVIVARYNLTSAPQEFVKNSKVNQMLKTEGVDILPVIMLDGEVVMTKRYPTNSEITALLELPETLFEPATKVAVKVKKTGGCGCADGKC